MLKDQIKNSVLLMYNNWSYIQEGLLCMCTTVALHKDSRRNSDVLKNSWLINIHVRVKLEAS